jgi:3-dehydrosphinganine reductase
MSYFNGKRVFLVGGSEGIGRATAIELVSGGANVVIAARRLPPLEEALAAMEAARISPSQVLSMVSMDVGEEESVAAGVAAVKDILGGLDVIITNVGFAQVGYIHEMETAVFEKLVNINYLGHARVIRAFLPEMMDQKSGDICLVSSALGFFSCAGYAPYSASKYAVRGFAEGLRQEMLDHNVRVTMFYPGTTETPGLAKENDGKPAAVWEMESSSSFNTIHQPAAVGKAILKAVERGRFDNVLGFDNWLMWSLFRWVPKTARWLADMEWKKAVKTVNSRRA